MNNPRRMLYFGMPQNEQMEKFYSTAIFLNPVLALLTQKSVLLIFYKHVVRMVVMENVLTQYTKFMGNTDNEKCVEMEYIF